MRLIDADALKKNIAKWLQGGDPQETVMVELDDIGVSVIMEIDEQPTIETIPVAHGEWVKNDIGIYFCSECDSEAYWDTDYGQQLFPCCPYCGIRMDGAK